MFEPFNEHEYHSKTKLSSPRSQHNKKHSDWTTRSKDQATLRINDQYTF